MKSKQLAIAALCAAYWAWAQQAPPKPAAQTPAATPSSGPTSLTATTQLVVEDVTVTDKSGKPIEGLTAKDFIITEDNVQQEIKFCEFQKMIETAAPLPEAPPVAPPSEDKPRMAAVPGVTS